MKFRVDVYIHEIDIHTHVISTDIHKTIHSSIIQNSKRVAIRMFRRVVPFGIEWEGPREGFRC